jgi:hypothetical protein
MNNEHHITHPTVFFFNHATLTQLCFFLLPNSSFVIDLCAEVFGTVGDEPPIISKKSKKLQNKLDNIRHKANIVMVNKAHERR